MGVFLRLATKNQIAEIDRMNMKTRPERVVGKEIDSVYSISDFARIIAKVEGYKGVAQYMHESSYTHRL